MGLDGIGRPFDAIRRELEASSRGPDPVKLDGELRLDIERRARTGVPEVVYAEYKSNEQVTESLRRLSRKSGRALAARCRAETLTHAETIIEDDTTMIVDKVARTIIASYQGAEPQKNGGKVGIVAAGTSDVPVAREATIMVEEMGCDVVAVNDVGVAGLHRLVVPLETMIEARVSVVVVVAGMDGALPSVVAGLVSLPVIGLPTSVGYGFGGGGEAALGTMLQTCVPGLVVVNIDNGIGAGATAALIANGVAAASR